MSVFRKLITRLKGHNAANECVKRYSIILKLKLCGNT